MYVKVHLVGEIVYQFTIKQLETKRYSFCKIEATNYWEKIGHANNNAAKL